MVKRGRPRNFDRTDALRRAMMAFWDYGYEGTSMSRLVAEMGINSPSIYAAFGSKENLFREAVALYRGTEGSRIWSATKAAPSARSAIETMLNVSAEEFTQPDKPRGCLVILGLLHVDASNEQVYSELKECRAESLETLVLRLKQGVRNGEFSDAKDCQAIASYYVAVQQGMSIQARDGASRQTLLNVADSAMKAWHELVVA